MKWKDILSGMKVADNFYLGKEILNSAALSDDKCGLRDLFTTHDCWNDRDEDKAWDSAVGEQRQIAGIGVWSNF